MFAILRNEVSPVDVNENAEFCETGGAPKVNLANGNDVDEVVAFALGRKMGAWPNTKPEPTVVVVVTAAKALEDNRETGRLKNDCVSDVVDGTSNNLSERSIA